MPKHGWNYPYGAEARITSGCSKRPSSKAPASEETWRTLRYVEPLSDARTPLADFFSILRVVHVSTPRVRTQRDLSVHRVFPQPAKGHYALARARRLEAIWCDSDERTSRPSGQSFHRCRRVFRDRHGTHLSCRRVRVSISAMRPAPHRVRPAAAVRCWQSRKGAVADCEFRARVV